MAFTWFGGHCGSGFASGRQIVQYNTRHGIAGAWIPILTWFTCGWFGYWACKYGIMIKARNYRDFTLSFYGVLGRPMLILTDVLTVLGSVVVLSIMFSAAAELFHTEFGLNLTIGAVATALICWAICVFGYKIYAFLNAYITLPMLAMLLIVQTCMIAMNWENLMLVIRTSGMSAESGGIIDMIKDGFTYSGVQLAPYAACFSTAIASDIPWTDKDTKIAMIGGACLNWFMHSFNMLMVYSGYPWVNSEALVTLNLVKAAGPNFTWLVVLYDIVLILAIITTTIGSIYVLIARFQNVGHTVVKKTETRRLIWGLIIVLAPMALSKIGLITLVNKGYGLVGGLRAPLTIWPCAILGIWRISCLKRRLAAGENIVPYDEAAEAAINAQ